MTYYLLFILYLEMAAHSSVLAWKNPWMEEPGGLRSMGSLRVGHDWATSLSLFSFIHWRRKWQPTPVFLPGESQGQGSLVGCCLWSRTVGHAWSDLAVAVRANWHSLWATSQYLPLRSAHLLPTSQSNLPKCLSCCLSFSFRDRGRAWQTKETECRVLSQWLCLCDHFITHKVT